MTLDHDTQIFRYCKNVINVSRISMRTLHTFVHELPQIFSAMGQRTACNATKDNCTRTQNVRSERGTEDISMKTHNFGSGLSREHDHNEDSPFQKHRLQLCSDVSEATFRANQLHVTKTGFEPEAKHQKI